MKITGVNHLTFSTIDINKSLNFYTHILGCDVVACWETGAYLLAGNTWLCLIVDNKTKQTPLPEYSHIAFHVDEDNFDKLVGKLKEVNTPIWKENKSEGKSLYFLDPDKNKLELHSNTLTNRIDYLKLHPYPGLQLNEKLLANITEHN